MNTIIFLIMISTGTDTPVVKEMNSLNQCEAIRDSIYEQQKEIGIHVNKKNYYCFNTTTKAKFYSE